MGHGSRRGRLILFAGLPGSGKTTIARLLAGRIRDLAMVSSDQLRMKGMGQRLWDRMRGMVEDGLARGDTVVVDATNYSRRHRERFLSAAREAGTPYVIVHLTARLPTLVERNKKREGMIPPGAIFRLSSLFETPQGRNVLSIDTEATAPEEAARIIIQRTREMAGDGIQGSSDMGNNLRVV